MIRGRGGGGRGAAVPSLSAVVRSSQQQRQAGERAVEEVWVRIVTEVKLKGRSENLGNRK